MDHFHISKVLRSESHHSWVNLYRGIVIEFDDRMLFLGAISNHMLNPIHHLFMGKLWLDLRGTHRSGWRLSACHDCGRSPRPLDYH